MALPLLKQIDTKPSARTTLQPARIKRSTAVPTTPGSYVELILSEGHDYLFPHIRELFKQTLHRAKMEDLQNINGLEVHDCFNITEYMILDHSGLCAPGEIWQAIEEGHTQAGGKLPVNMSGGLIGLGHPVGATGVRMALDCYKQVTYKAGDYQIGGARNMMTFNLGGSATTCASLIIGRE